MSGELIAEGGYGCVFHPEISCSSGKDTTEKRYISKLQPKDFSSENEIQIGLMLKKAEHGLLKNSDSPLINNFAPVLSSCEININKLNTMSDKCSIIKKSGKKDFVLMKIQNMQNTLMKMEITCVGLS